VTDALIRTNRVNSVIDLSHHNGAVDLGKASAAGILAVIHKATQGRTVVDPTYAPNRGIHELSTLSTEARDGPQSLHAIEPEEELHATGQCAPRRRYPRSGN
jgi:Glycosyl hydrolases family 25